MAVHFKKALFGFVKIKFDFANWAVSVFADVNVSDALAVGFFVVHFFAIKHHDDIGVLFDGT